MNSIVCIRFTQNFAQEANGFASRAVILIPFSSSSLSLHLPVSLILIFFSHSHIFLFYRADLNGDNILSLQELARYINRRIRDHIETSIRNNPILFSEIDRSPPNGLITWDEYYTYFLRQLGYDDAFIEQIDRERSSNFDRKTKDLLLRDKALWNEAARTDTFSLTLDEFLAFKHPGKVHILGQVFLDKHKFKVHFWMK